VSLRELEYFEQLERATTVEEVNRIRGEAQREGWGSANLRAARRIRELQERPRHYIGDGCELLPDDHPQLREHGLAALASLAAGIARQSLAR
jgi:hypothetical protein